MSYDTYGAYIRAQEVDRIVAAIDRLTTTLALAILADATASREDYGKCLARLRQLAGLDKEEEADRG